ENALKHGSPSEPVEISLCEDGRLIVRNGGHTISPEQLKLLRNRFERSNTNASGSGLGLAIADAIAEGAGMALYLRSPATGRQDGFEAELVAE
ncbi:ATP-binding protein, partial [Marinobacter bryozoorum]|uniref:ATP-binding protein n=1 Tax=Marinobacter bryozoorum TaxID=256324 RepID=UPI002003F4B5